ncbi:hypothetical protein OHV13_30240 [Kitasatospora purpeofusca]|uniref:hypothetical protein n=1 Tax=Kitasatospora purpeofusca TaxID=67352 RepID=UPI00324F9C17
MSTVLLDKPVAEIRPTSAPVPSTLPERDREAGARACPVCGSGSTYQMMDGRWGCTQCGSTWS